MTNLHIDQLAIKIRSAKDAYYNSNPIMSDAEFDAIEDELRKLDPNHPVLTLVGSAPVNGSWPIIKHEIPMGSLNKAQTKEEMQAWINKSQATEMVITDKLDGSSIELVYKKRHLVQAVTRGDGITGQNITRNALLMQGVVKVLPATINGLKTPDEVYIRGEVIVTKDLFAKHFKGESNPRNTASGTMVRQTNYDKCKHLTIMTYQLLGVNMNTKKAELETLTNIGFIVPKWSVVNSLSKIEKIYQNYINGIRDGLNYQIDGLVIDVNDRHHFEKLGDLNSRPKGAIAYKFPHESKSTELTNIRWQVGNSGRITPVAEFKTVDLAGVHVSQASLHNIRNIEFLSKKLRPGFKELCLSDTILVSRRNDVIPYVESVLKSGDTSVRFYPPTECPVCGEKLSMDGEYLVCTNSDECEAQVIGMLKRWCAKLDIKHMGEAVLSMLIEDGHINDIADLYLINPADVSVMTMNGRTVGASADRGFKNLHLKKSLPLPLFIGSLGIPLIGRSMAQIIFDAGYDTLSKMYQARIVDIAKIPKVGDVKAKAFVKGFKKKIPLIHKLLGDPNTPNPHYRGAGITIKVTTGPLKGQTFCMTGFRDSKLGDALESLGGTLKSGVSKSLDYLIVQDVNSTSGKAKKARKYGVTIIDIDEAKKKARI